MRRFFWFITASLLLVSCTGSKSSPTATKDPQAIMTAVQLTVQYNLTELVALTPSATVTPTITETLSPSPTTLAYQWEFNPNRAGPVRDQVISARQS